jgi:hypothetical protein
MKEFLVNMPEWEYMIEPIGESNLRNYDSLESILKDHGEKGWELASIMPDELSKRRDTISFWLVFKKEK